MIREHRNLLHDALFYADLDGFLTGTRDFVEAGLAAGQPVLVAVPWPKIEILRSALNGSSSHVEFVDMTELGRNPSRIIPAVREWVERQGDRRCRFIGEPLWPGRSDDEVAEATRHEALLNLAFADAPVAILCPYDTSGLEPGILADAERTHPHLIRGKRRVPSPRYADPIRMCADWQPLQEPAQPVARMPITDDLAALRRFVEAGAAAAGLSTGRASDLVLAANEAATNAMVHTEDPDQLRIWQDHARVTCEITDHGRLVDPLAGRTRPSPTGDGGRGLWLINQLCDLVELRPSDAGTTIRLHVDLER